MAVAWEFNIISEKATKNSLSNYLLTPGVLVGSTVNNNGDNKLKSSFLPGITASMETIPALKTSGVQESMRIASAIMGKQMGMLQDKFIRMYMQNNFSVYAGSGPAMGSQVEIILERIILQMLHG